MNSFTGVGRLTKDIVLKETGAKTPYARVTIAIGDGYFKDGKEGVDYIPLLLWKGNAVNAAKYLKKGSLISFRGRYKSNSYQDQSGKTVYGHDIVAEEVRFLDKKETTIQQPQQSEDPSATNQSQSTKQGGYTPPPQVENFGFHR